MTETAWRLLLVVTTVGLIVEGVVIVGILRELGALLLQLGPARYGEVEEGPEVGTALDVPVLLFGEDGSYQGTDDQIDFWWNVDPDQWVTAMPGHDPGPTGADGGSTTFLGSEPLGDSCRFEFVFEVPDYEPGDYPVIGLILGGGGGGLYGGDGVEFHVNN